MLLLSKKSGLGLLFLLLAGMHAPNGIAITLRKSAGTVRVYNELGSGIAGYQDIQIPQYLNPSLRANGRVASVENGFHLGIPVKATAGVEVGSPDYFSFFELSALKISSINSPRETADSSYDRVGFDVGAELYAFTLLNTRVSPRFSLGYRKDRFYNISSGHYVKGLFSKLGLSLNPGQRLTLLAGGGYGINPEFGYDDGKKEQALAPSNATSAEAALKIDYHLDRSASIGLSLEWERTTVEMQNVFAYDAFGLIVNPSVGRTRRYVLDTNIAAINFTKRW